MTLTTEEMKEDIILLWCKKCKKTTRHTPTTQSLTEKRIYHWPTRQIRPAYIYCRPEHYRCTECNRKATFKSLAHTQGSFFNKRRYAKKEEKQQT